MGCLRTHLPWVSGIPTPGSWSFGHLTTISMWSAGSGGGLLGRGPSLSPCFCLGCALFLELPAYPDSAGHSHPSQELAVGLQVGHLPL